MSLYSLALFLHVVGALGLFVTIGLEWTSLSHLRRAASAEQVRTWLPVMGSLRSVGGPSALALLVTGIYMMVTTWRGAAWGGLGLIGMVIIAVLGGVLTGRRMGPIAQALSAERDAVSPSLAERLRDPVLVLSARLRAALALGVVFIMCVKPDAGGSLSAMGAALTVGLVAGFAAFPQRSGALRPE